MSRFAREYFLSFLVLTGLHLGSVIVGVVLSFGRTLAELLDTFP